MVGCSNPDHYDSTADSGVKEYLSKEEAAAFVIEARKAKKETLDACAYDPVVADLMNLRVDPRCQWVPKETGGPRSATIVDGFTVFGQQRRWSGPK